VYKTSHRLTHTNQNSIHCRHHHQQTVHIVQRGDVVDYAEREANLLLLEGQMSDNDDDDIVAMERRQIWARRTCGHNNNNNSSRSSRQQMSLLCHMLLIVLYDVHRALLQRLVLDW
jgi:hypothetical protein